MVWAIKKNLMEIGEWGLKVVEQICKYDLMMQVLKTPDVSVGSTCGIRFP